MYPVRATRGPCYLVMAGQKIHMDFDSRRWALLQPPPQKVETALDLGTEGRL